MTQNKLRSNMTMDATDLLELEARMVAAVEDLQKRASAVAMSRQIKEFSSDMRKNLLAKYTAPLLKDNSATAADTMARANDDYQFALGVLADQYRKAEKHLAEWDALHCKYEAARSALSLARSQIQL